MTWLANALLIWGLILIGGKNRTGFFCTFLGEAIWIVASWDCGRWDMLSICVVFAVLAAVNWLRWGDTNREEDRVAWTTATVRPDWVRKEEPTGGTGMA